MNRDTNFLVQMLRLIGHEADEAADLLKRRLLSRFAQEARLEVIAYRGYGNRNKSKLTGRVLEYQKSPAQDLESHWNNLKHSYRRFETDEVPDVLVGATVAGQTYHALSDSEGYFAFEFDTPSAENARSFSVNLTLPDKNPKHVIAQGTIYIPDSKAMFGVISDIDDTILETNATSILQMMKLTLLESSRTRVAFSGVDELYQALHQNVNPMFYVSSSPWNLYDFLVDFMKLNNLVDGPLLLRDFGVDKSKFIAGPHLDHKLSQIRKILLHYPGLPFILIGDSGQDDPEIYEAIASEFPKQILSCYIRDVSGAARDRKVQSIMHSLTSQNVDMLLIPDSTAAAAHAVSKNWITEESLNAVKNAVNSTPQAVS